MKLRLVAALGFLCPLLTNAQSRQVQGTVIDAATREPIKAATVHLLNSQTVVRTDSSGRFKLLAQRDDRVQVTAVGYQTELQDTRNDMEFRLRMNVPELDEALVIAYGSTTRRFSTGSVGKVAAAEIQRQPVTNPLAAISGRVPGLVVSQTNGMPGAAVNIEIRGKSSLLQGSSPLFIVDGVPFGSNNASISQLSSAAGPVSGTGISPFTAINPNDIESIEILKDADATAIYGSRGANGVVLITTKSGKTRGSSLGVNIWTAISSPTRFPDMMNTAEYLKMRREAFVNDGITPTLSTAPDLLAWDTTRFTDFKKFVLDNNAVSTNAQVNYSAGNSKTGFNLGSGYSREGTILPGSFGNTRINSRMSIQHSDLKDRLKVNLQISYAFNKNNIPSSSMMSAITLPPNAPALRKPDGSLNWEENGVSFANPLAFTLQKYESRSNAFVSSANISYQISSSFQFRVAAGFNGLSNREFSISPASANNPLIAGSNISYSLMAENNTTNWLAEPQLEYAKQFSKSKLSILTGLSWQQTTSQGTRLDARGFASEALMLSPAAAERVVISSNYNDYRYTAAFARFNYNWNAKYILNASGRYDGSSRFGPGKRFSLFSALGGAWVVSNEPWLKNLYPTISFLKLRGSFGVTGNDQIGDYRYLDTWLAGSTYGNSPTLIPGGLFNENFEWERNRKLEGAMDIGLVNDRILFSFAYFRTRSDNQLINYNLPAQSGFSIILRNLPASIQNAGLESTLNLKLIDRPTIGYNLTLVSTIQRNKLRRFPGLESTSYASTYVVGESISIQRGYRFIGINQSTGLFEFQDVTGDGIVNFSDEVVLGDLAPRVFGGVSNSFRFKQWQLDIFLELRKVKARSYYSAITQAPGQMINQPRFILDRWVKPGDNANFQRFTSSSSSAAAEAFNLYTFSNGSFEDASFIRGKNASISYNLPSGILRRYHVVGANLYVSAQNFFTISQFPGDPENAQFNTVPLLKTFAIGINVQF